MKKAIKVSKKALSVTLALLMVFTSWVWFAPDKAEAAEGNKYYVKVYVNIYDGSDGYGGAYAVEETTGKPKNYSWATNDGWYGRINMTGFTVFGEDGDYDAQDVSEALIRAEGKNSYYAMSGLSDNNAEGDWDSKRIDNEVYTFVLDSFPIEVFWINDENNWDGGNTGFAIRKLTVATSEGGTEHTMWEGLAGSDSETYNYYGSITPTGIHTCFEDYAKNYDMNDYKFYKSITTSSQRAWTDPYTYGSAGTYYLNEYANGGVSATFSEGTTSVASTVDYIDTSSTDTYYVNYTNHSKTQIAEITGTYNDGNFVTSPYRTKLNPGETRSFEINKSNYSKLAKYNNAANFTFEYTLSDVYASDELNAPLAKFIQPTYIGLWNESNDSPKYITDEDGDGSTGYTLKMSDNYSGGNNSMTMTNTFQVTEGIIERNSATSGSGTNSVSFNYNYYVDVSNVSTWENTGLRIYVTENEYYRLPFQPKEHPSECGTITLSGNYANTDAASITIADIAFTNVTEDFWYSHSQASGYSTYGYYNQKGTPMWATQGKDAQATFFNNNPGWLRFAGTMIEPSADSADPAKIVMDKMVYRENQNGQKAYFSGTINVYAFDKAELRDYIQKTLLDFAPMSLRYNTTAFGTYQNKLVAAMNVLADQKTTQKAVATALSELKSAVDNLQTTDNLINQVAELTHVQYVGSIGSEIANQTDERYVLVTLGEHTVPKKTEYIGNGEYKNATNKNSDLKTNYSKTDTDINIINYRYWNIDYSAIDSKIVDLETAINSFDENLYKKSFKTDLENAKANLEAMKATVDVINTPTSQEDIEVLIINADNLITHLGNNMRVHQWIEDTQGNYVAEMDEATHWYTCKICGYELVYNHTFAYENINALQHKATCVTSGTDEGCGYSFTEDHIWVEGETVATSCTEANVNYSCVCGATKTEAVTVSNHKFAVADNGDGTHISKCSECGANKPDAVAEAHTLSYVNNNDGTHTATCSVCSATEKVAHTFINPVLARPTLVDGEWVDGYYTSTCNCGDTSTTEAKRADYEAYDKAVADLNALLANEKLTDAAKTEISNVLAANDIADNYIATAEEQKIVNDATASLKVVLDKINNDTTGAYEKVDFTNYNKAVNAYVALDSVMTAEDKAAVEAEMQKVTDAGIDENTSKAVGQKTLDDAADAISAINAKYGECAKGNHTDTTTDNDHNCDVCGTKLSDCADNDKNHKCDTCGATLSECADNDKNHKCDICGTAMGTHADTNNDHNCEYCGDKVTDCADDNNDHNCDVCGDKLSDCSDVTTDNDHNCDVCGKENVTDHNYVNPVLTRPTLVDGEWVDGYYTSTCNCGATSKTEAKRADYKAYDKAVADLNALLANEKLTDAAKTEISNVLAANDIADNYIATAEEQKIVDDAAAALNVVLGELTDDEGNLKDEYEKVDFTGYNAAVDASDLLEDVMTDADKAAVEASKNTVTDAGITAETSKADGQATLDKAAEDIAKINAKYGDCATGNHTDTTTDNDHNCDVCGKADVTAHNYADATCTAPKTCTECGATDGEALEHEDTDNDHICNNGCNDKISDCSDVTTDNDHNCDICGAENVTDHDYEYNVVVTTPTCTTGGLTTKTCNCGHSITVDVVPANGHSWSEPSALYEDDSTGKFGYYNYVCGSCGESVNVYVERADYTVYDSLVKAYEDIVNDSELWDSLTDETVSALSNVKIKLDEIPLIYTAKSTDEETKIVTPDGQAELDASIAGIIIDLEKIQQSIESGSGLRLDASEFEKVVSEYEGDPFDGIDATCDIVSAEDAEYVNNIINETRVFVSENLDKSSASDEQKKIDAATEDIRKIIEKYAYCLEHGHVWGEWVENIVLDSENNFVSATYSRTCDKCGKVDTYYAYLEDYSEYDTAVENATNLLDNEKLTDAAKDIISEAITNAEKLDQNLPGDIIAGWDDEGNEIKIDVNENAETIKGYTDALNDVINSLYDENGNLKAEFEKVDFTNYNAAVNASEVLEDVMTDADKAVVAAEKQKVTDAGITTETSKAVGQQTLEDAAAAIAAINAKYGDCADGNHVWGEPVLTTDPTETTQGEYTETCKTCGTTQITKVDRANYSEFDTVVDQLEDLLDTENLTDEAKTAIENALAKAEALDKNLPDDATTVDGKLIEGGQDEIDALVTELNSVVANTNASISDGSALKPDYEAWKEAEGAYDALDKKNVKDEIKAEADALKAEIAEKQDDDTLTQATATQDDIDDATARLNEIIAGINDGTLIKDADFTEVDKDLADAKDKAENNNVVDSVKDKIDEIEEKLEALEGANADKQGEIDTLEDQLEDIIAGITDGSLVKPDYDAWDEAESTYDELDKTNVNSNIIAEADALKAEIAEKQADDTLTKATATQKDINDATARLNEIITGINNGTLKNPADFTEVNKDLAEAKDKAENNNVVDSVKDKIDEIEEKLEALEGANADKQGEIDTLEDQLEDIIAGITDGSLVKPDYSGADDVIGKAENDIDNGGKLSDEDKAALEELKKNLDEIKNDPTSNKKDDQSTVDSIKDSVQNIINKYSGCAEGNHNYVAKVVEPGCETTGYTEHKCTVCGKAYRDNLKPATGHSVITVPAMDATCSEEGRTEGKICENCGKIFVEIEVIPRLPHTDEDEDGVCDICGASDLYAGCACLCHNKHWFWHIIYLIVRIIWRVFGIHQYCACGFVHLK